MNLVVFPFHDYRKSLAEGFRTRDGHFIEHLGRHSLVDTLVIVNRPFPLIGFFLKSAALHIDGEVVDATWNCKLIRVSKKVYVVDFISLDVIDVVLQGRRWFWKAYTKPAFVRFITRALKKLGISDFNILSETLQNVDLVPMLSARKVVLDAFDNWLRIPLNDSMLDLIKSSYADYAKTAKVWITNSAENKDFYERTFHKSDIDVIANGVDTGRFNPGHALPADLRNVTRPIIGFGGKMTHLIDTDLVNFLLDRHPEKSFVFVGQILDKRVFKMIAKRDNFIYLGDKHYDEYPAYIEHFDVCIIPYHYGEKAHGGDSIKFYEYLAANKIVVTTPGNGAQRLNENVLIAEDKESFSRYLDEALKKEPQQFKLPANCTWEYKTNLILAHFND